MKKLLEDYQRKLASMEIMTKDKANMKDIESAVRLHTKAGEYRSFIVDIERAIERDKSEMFENMQYYMEYCQGNSYVTPQEWIEKHKHF